MKLTIEQIRAAAIGATYVVLEEDKLCFYRFNSSEISVIDNPNVQSPAGIRIRFKTDGNLLKMKIHTQALSPIRSYFSFDVLVNGVIAGCIQNLSDNDCKGDYANKSYPLGSFQEDFCLGHGEKCVELVFPHSVKASIESVEIVDATYVLPVKKNKTMLFYGDSITQGYDALHPSKSYAARLADAMDADVVNKALGGAVFDPRLVQIPWERKPDYVVVAYGTNDWNSVDLKCFKKNAEGFRRGIETNYSNIPVFMITPIWRSDWLSSKKCGAFFNIEKTIRDVFENRPNITVISGTDLVPHNIDFFGDLWVHPNDSGFRHYADNLKKYLV